VNKQGKKGITRGRSTTPPPKRAGTHKGRLFRLRKQCSPGNPPYSVEIYWDAPQQYPCGPAHPLPRVRANFSVPHHFRLAAIRKCYQDPISRPSRRHIPPRRAPACNPPQNCTAPIRDYVGIQESHQSPTLLIMTITPDWFPLSAVRRIRRRMCGAQDPAPIPSSAPLGKTNVSKLGQKGPHPLPSPLWEMSLPARYTTRYTQGVGSLPRRYSPRVCFFNFQVTAPI